MIIGHDAVFNYYYTRFRPVKFNVKRGFWKKSLSSGMSYYESDANEHNFLNLEVSVYFFYERIGFFSTNLLYLHLSK